MGDYIGVGYHNGEQAYYARICHNYNQKWLGYFNCEIEAAKAYNHYIDKYNLRKQKNVINEVTCNNCVRSCKYKQRMEVATQVQIQTNRRTEEEKLKQEKKREKRKQYRARKKARERQQHLEDNNLIKKSNKRTIFILD